MKVFVINREAAVVSLVFHDYIDGSYFCKSTSESFKKVFNNFCLKSSTKLIKREGKVLKIDFDSFNYGWMENVLGKFCNGFWIISEMNEIPNNHEEVEKLVSKYFKDTI